MLGLTPPYLGEAGLLSTWDGEELGPRWDQGHDLPKELMSKLKPEEHTEVDQA